MNALRQPTTETFTMSMQDSLKGELVGIETFLAFPETIVEVAQEIIEEEVRGENNATD